MNNQYSGKRVIYCEVWHNGKLISYTNMSTALRLQRRGLAKLIGESRIELLYQPGANRGVPLIVLKSPDKTCIQCGSKNAITRHHVVPRILLKCFNVLYKKDFSNIVPLCLECHHK